MNIVLIDDHAILGDSLKSLFEDKKEFKVVKNYLSGNDFLKDSISFTPTVIISDLNMPGINGIDFTEKCRKIYGDKVKIIILSMINDSQTIKKMMRLGVNGFVSKASGFSELLYAINEVLLNKKYISKDLKERMFEDLFSQEQVVYHLSPRENEVLKMVCNGKTIKEIGYELGLSPSTVQYYHKCIMQKFKLKRTSDLIVFAIKNGLYIPTIENNFS
jgi:two-component system, NarL family, invasion response regulator UvrY